MAIYTGSASATGVYVGSKSAKVHTYVNGAWKQVFPHIMPVETIDLSAGNAQTQFRNKLRDYGTSYTNVTEVPFNINFTGTGSTESMFSNCSALMTAPLMNTAKVTSMYYMFYGCTALTTIPQLDTSSVTDMYGAFSTCPALTSVPTSMNTANVTRMDNMFYGCSSLVTAPQLSTASVTRMSYMFDGCSSLTSVPNMDARALTGANYMFRNTPALKDGKVKLIRPTATKPTAYGGMINGSGLTREPFYLTNGTPI